MQSGLIVAIADHRQHAVFFRKRDALRHRNGLLALGPFDGQLIADGDLHALRQRNQFFSNSRHKIFLRRLPLPNVAQNFAADAFFARRRTRHHAPRRGQDVDPQSAQNARHFF